MSDIVQEHLDRFYFAHGRCCAGCDWWRSINSIAGECTNAAPVSGVERMDMLGIDWSSHRFGAGHPITSREHVCGQFKDEFDWASLPLPYRKRVGAPV